MKAEVRLERREENLEELQEAAWGGGGAAGAWSVPGYCQRLALTEGELLHHAGYPRGLSSSA